MANFPVSNNPEEARYALALEAFLADTCYEPFTFVMGAFPWGEEGTELESRAGPEAWQVKVLMDLQNGTITWNEAFQIAIKSGHEVGKSALLCWLALWGFSTKPGSRVRVTANTEKQLRVVLWVELAKWFQLFIAKQFFEFSATKICSLDPKYSEHWRIDAVTWNADNPAAFAGPHNQGNRLIYIFDEAEGIPDIIWEVADGAMRSSDTELLWVATSQPRRNLGRFFECFNRFAAAWHKYTIDSREVSFTNKAVLDRDIELWGEDHDVIRVRVKGEFPNAASNQLFPTALLQHCQRSALRETPWEPLILGVDVSRAGAAETVAQFRRGRDARSIPVTRWTGAEAENPTQFHANKIGMLIAQHRPDAVFVDMGGYGGGVVDFLRTLGHSCIGVDFGSSASTSPMGFKVANKRAEMYVSLLEWLRQDGCIQAHPDLEKQLVAISYSDKEKRGLLLRSKEEMRALGIPSPDWADALVLTFAFPVLSKTMGVGREQAMAVDYDPLGPDALPSSGPDPKAAIRARATAAFGPFTVH